MNFFNRIVSIVKGVFTFDIRSLALFRVGIAFILFWDLLLQFSNLSDFYTDNGLLPRSALLGNLGFIDFHAISGTYSFQCLLLLIAAIFCFCLLIGYHTRTATIVSWLLQVSIQNRNPLVTDKGDLFLLVILFWSIFLPLGAYYSIDSIGKFLERKSYCVFSGATIAFLCQIFFIYFFTALLKTDPQWHQQGSAVYYTLRIEQYATPLTSFLLSAPSIVLICLTHLVFWTEAGLPFFLFFPIFKEQVRTITVFVFILFHIGLGMFLSLGTFIWIPIVSLLALLPSYFWNQLYGLLQKYFPVNLTIYFDDDCSFCRNSVAFISYALLLYGVRIVPAQSVPKIYQKMQHHNSWIVADAKGKLYFKEQALARLLRSSPVFFIISPLFSWKPVVLIGDKVYETIVKHRFLACEIPKPPRKLFIYTNNLGKVIINSFVLSLLVCVTLWNLSTLPKFSITFPQPVVNLMLFLRLNQKWDMFAPRPTTDDGWYVVPATLKNGETVDLFTNRQVTWKKPPLISQMYKDERWTTYMIDLWYASKSYYRPFFASYLCNKWNRTHGSEEQAQNLSIYFMYKQIPPPFANPVTPAAQYDLLDYSCL